jgi:membrane associated rhomboid family serine protease
MFVPLLHERMVVARRPWVSVALVVACIVAFPITAWSPEEREADQSFVAAVTFLAGHPETRPDPRLLSAEEAKELRESASTPAPESDDEPEVAQAELDRRTEKWLQATERAPLWRFGLVPAERRAPSLVTHLFLHVDLLHLLGNLLVLYLTAPLVEDRIGRGRFLAAYLGLGALAGLAYTFHFPTLYRPLVGASGAISAVIGMFVVLYAGVRLRYLLWIGVPLGIFQAPAWVMFPVWFILQLLLGLDSSGSGGGGVAYWAHAWGFIGGIAAGALLRSRSPTVEVAAPDPLAEASRLEKLGRREQAWQLLLAAFRGGDEREELILRLWQLARLVGRSAEAAPAFGRLIRNALRAGDPFLAAERWQEAKSALRGAPIDPSISFAVATALDKTGEAREAREEIVAVALAGLRPTTAVEVASGLARLARQARSPDARDALAAALARSDLPPQLRAALEESGIQSRAPTRFGKA